MNYTQEERLAIGRRIYNNEITRYEAAEEYGISDQTARTYMRLYQAVNHLPPKSRNRKLIANKRVLDFSYGDGWLFVHDENCCT